MNKTDNLKYENAEIHLSVVQYGITNVNSFDSKFTLVMKFGKPKFPEIVVLYSLLSRLK